VSTTPLILDVDTGVDDAIALLYACASPEVRLVGVTCVMGNVTVEQATRNTLEVLGLAGHEDVEVARGAGRPLVRDHESFPMVHGPEGLGHWRPRGGGRAPSDRGAVPLIVDTARARPGEVLLVATGPLTNVALALAEEPGLPELLKGFALMGGAYDRAGNTTPAAEANVWMDPEAAAAVFGAFSGAPLDKLPICVGLDVTERALLAPADLDAARSPAPDSSLARFLLDAVGFYMEFHRSSSSKIDGALMHDPLALAIAIDPSLAQIESTRVEVETTGTWTSGATVADLGGLRRSRWRTGWATEDNARVAVDVDETAFTERLVERLASLVRVRAGT
jgi:purine nucleosidase